MAGVVVGKVVRAVSIADDEELKKAKKRLGVAIAGVVLVLDYLFHGPPWLDAEGFQLDLHTGDSIDQDEHIVTVVAVVRVDAKLIDDLEGVFAPILDIDQGEIERSSVIAGEAVALAQRTGGGENVRGNDFFEKPGKFAGSQSDAVQGFELCAEVLLQSRSVANVLTIFVFQAAEFLDELFFKLAFL